MLSLQTEFWKVQDLGSCFLEKSFHFDSLWTIYFFLQVIFNVKSHQWDDTCPCG